MITFFTSFVLMFLFSLLLLEFFLLPFLDFLVWFPAFFSVKNHVTVHVHGVWNFRKTVISASRTKFYFILNNIELLPTKVTFPNESSDWRDNSTIKWNEFDTHVSGYVLNGEIGTDQSDGKLFLLLSLFLVLLSFKYFTLGWLFGCWFFLNICSVNFCHFFSVIIGGNPTLLIVDITLLLFLSFLFVLRYFNPSFLVIQWFFSLGIFVFLLLAILLLDCLLFIFYYFLNDRKRLLS